MGTIADVGGGRDAGERMAASAGDGLGRLIRATDHRGELCARRIRCRGGAPLWSELQYAVHLATAKTWADVNGRRQQDSEHCAGAGRGSSRRPAAIQLRPRWVGWR